MVYIFHKISLDLREYTEREKNSMKKRMLAMFLAIMTCVTIIWSTGTDVKAEDIGEDISFSELLTENTLVGIAQMQTRGVYLAEGNSYISKISTTKIGAGGDTIAAKKCKVSVTAIVERLDNGLWGRVTSWTSTTTSGYSASISKSLTITRGYYYRVRSAHYASTDVSSSCTSALWMGN